jgi:NDP-sugar pyrophosphorylase family protein
VLVHNVDVLTNISFRRLYRAHEESEALVTMVVQHRETTRGLVADEDGNLCGRAEQTPVRPPRGKLFPFGFNGISILSPGLAAELPGDGAFGLVDSFLALASDHRRVRVFNMDAWYWADAGTPERLANLKRDISTKKIPVESLYM